MRERLLDATVECLVELGYSGTSTTMVCQRAGVSRGAQLHHFPKKSQLVTTAVEHLFSRMNEEFLGTLSRLPAETDKAAPAIDLLWEMLSGPTYSAWLELVVASRTDSELRAAVTATTERIGDTVSESFTKIFPQVADDPFLVKVVPSFVFTVLEGLALRGIADRDSHEKEILGVLRALARLVGPTMRSGIDLSELENH